MANVAVCICLHDDHWFVEATLKSFASAGPMVAFVSRLAWNGSPGDWERCAKAAEAAGAEVVLGDWPDETLHRRTALAAMKERGFEYVFIPDGDEVIEPRLLEYLLKIAETNLADVVHVRMDTYWKSAHYVIRPREDLAPAILLNAQVAVHHHIRDYRGERHLTLSPEYGVLHHLSYAGPDERIQRKISTWGHRHEVGEQWYRRVWQGWDQDPLMRNLHPTHPACYGFTERIQPPEILGGAPCHHELKEDPEVPKAWPKVSVIIPLHGGTSDIRLCLESLAKCADITHELIVVDDVSPDDAPEVVKEFPFVTLIRNETNLGFAGTCNRGYEESTGEVIVFLNSDTAVPRAGLIRLVEALLTSGSVGASGPYTNNAGYYQPITPTYTSQANLDLFAQDFAHREADDRDVSLLVGFCLAIRRSTLEEVGVFDMRFGRGMFEDNDLCYRLARAGYKLRIAARSYVHHAGSQTLKRLDEHPHALLKRNMAVFHAKWQAEVESGYASHLPGQEEDPITFRPERHPDRLRKEMLSQARQADISLCMIVKDEERVLGACLASVKDAFRQIIVVDTGSTDRTMEIAKEHGAELYEIPWPDSFSLARNESLKYAKGKWIFWTDADDTIPLWSLERILHAAIHAPAHVVAFVVPVQFVEDGPGAGTRVDHVKLFRNLPSMKFEGRIHEQILPSLREVGGEIARIDAVVLHSGYDTSPEGQAKKRLRDEKLLTLDLEDRPDHPFVLFNLGMTAHYSQNHEAAVQWLRRSIGVAEPTESHVRKAYALLGVSLRELSLAQDALAAFMEGLELVGEDPELRFQAGIVLNHLGRLEEAKAMYLAIQPDTMGFFSSVDIGILGFKRSLNLGSVIMQMRNYPEAKQWWRRAMAENPKFPQSALHLFEAAKENQDVSGMREAVHAFEAADGQSETWALMQVGIAEMLGEKPEDALWRLFRPGSMGIGLVIAKRMLARGEEQAAMPLLEQLDSWGSAEAAFYLGVAATRRGENELALRQMKRSLQLNPGHELTMEQIQALDDLAKNY